jgi:hypothetical protein
MTSIDSIDSRGLWVPRDNTAEYHLREGREGRKGREVREGRARISSEDELWE